MSFPNIDEYFEEDFNIDEDVLVQQDADTPAPVYLDVLKHRFGHQCFRPMQWKIINSIINERRDVCAIMATGYGKSLCFQFPSVFNNGLTFVISPLISLMEDQILSLEMNSIPACLLGSAQNKKQVVMNDIISGQYTIVYATPEYCLGDYGQDILKHIHSSVQIDLLAIDEAHCVSQWGHDFRVQYRNLWKLRNIFSSVPILAVTATATPKVQNDIITSLKLRDPVILCSSFDRPNLYFEVKMKSSSTPFDDLQTCMLNSKTGKCFPGSTIIYCLTKKITEDVQRNLQTNGIIAVRYHAGLSIKERKESHEKFVKDKVKVVVATIAFGMGIDKPDVRTVIHYGASKDIEGYYQEVGRAGRDGLPAKCVVFFSNADFILHQHLRSAGHSSKQFQVHQAESAQTMQKYLDLQDCRRQFILNYFEEGTSADAAPKKSCCDNCTRKITQPHISNKYEGVDDTGLYNIAEDARLFLQAVDALNGMFGVNMYVLLLRGSRSSKLFTKYHTHALHGKGKHGTDEWWKIIARLLNTEGYLQNNYKKQQGKMSYVVISVSPKGQTFLNQISQNPKLELKISPPQDMKKLMKFKSTTDDSGWHNAKVGYQQSDSGATARVATVEDPAEKMYRYELYKLLMATRNEFATKSDNMPYLVASNCALHQLSKFRPTTVTELKSYAIDGFNVGKIAKFGEGFLSCIKQFMATNVAPNKPKTIKPTKPQPVATTSTTGLALCIPNTSNNTNEPNKVVTNEIIDNNHSTNRVPVLKRFAFVQRAHTVTKPIDEDETITDVTQKTNSSYSWLDSPERKEESLVPISQQINDTIDDSFLLDDDSFDDDLMNVVDNIENTIKEPSQIANANIVFDMKKDPILSDTKMESNDFVENADKETVINNVVENDSTATRTMKKKANSSFNDWWIKKKKTKFDGFLDE